MQSYINWYNHGKLCVLNENIHDNEMSDGDHMDGIAALVGDQIIGEPRNATEDEEVRHFEKVEEDAKRELYIDKRVDDGIMRHSTDSEEWKEFDLQYPDFALEPRNVRLRLATDGFNPFENMNNNYSIWPVILIPYNLPPWLVMNEP